MERILTMIQVHHIKFLYEEKMQEYGPVAEKGTIHLQELRPIVENRY
ncbi:hypothetical protein [Lysinibacillus pakistanensis]|uniref:Uncharacterized protein n=1 Tax=Lysinibacillus pakistanensis TaxID=759811 RepID=A0AAX3WXG3_9BACI|nr:hypothetical protein [Lysinibacillus pakistanensis]MDM5230889.1 hypothetical protein [Lysinibacillus pakistanensis]WHY46455.1 hypothetical protein QNH22_24990 [Lysinibacillus pakistanensis]WHY51468.1 hypothetical protein QNH24_24950 [Lysinibacillus pakistanensis]